MVKIHSTNGSFPSSLFACCYISYTNATQAIIFNIR
eukprot:UN24824